MNTDIREVNVYKDKFYTGLACGIFCNPCIASISVCMYDASKPIGVYQYRRGIWISSIIWGSIMILIGILLAGGVLVNYCQPQRTCFYSPLTGTVCSVNGGFYFMGQCVGIDMSATVKAQGGAVCGFGCFLVIIGILLYLKNNNMLNSLISTTESVQSRMVAITIPEKDISTPLKNTPKVYSIETLSMKLNLPKLLEASNVDEILSMNFKDMREKYNITSDEFIKIKEYKTSMGM